jgi:hypothetical protein
MNNVTYTPVKAGIHVVVFRTVMKKEKSNRANDLGRGKCKVSPPLLPYVPTDRRKRSLFKTNYRD